MPAGVVKCCFNFGVLKINFVVSFDISGRETFVRQFDIL